MHTRKMYLIELLLFVFHGYCYCKFLSKDILTKNRSNVIGMYPFDKFTCLRSPKLVCYSGLLVSKFFQRTTKVSYKS